MSWFMNFEMLFLLSERKASLSEGAAKEIGKTGEKKPTRNNKTPQNPQEKPNQKTPNLKK